jgi:phosphate starvation-inducible PhoH-like protein
VDRYLEKGVIEIAPIAFMRGRTLNDSFVILDEAQNTTCEQMKMFITRMGVNSKMVITGDVTQIDLPNPSKSGLIEVLKVLQGVDGICFQHFTDADVVRHELVQRIVRAYDAYKTQPTPLTFGALGIGQSVQLSPAPLTPMSVTNSNLPLGLDFSRISDSHTIDCGAHWDEKVGCTCHITRGVNL